MPDQQTARATHPPDAADEIALEPSMSPEDHAAPEEASGDDSAGWFGASASDVHELTPLLRWRLRAAAGFLAAAYLVFFLFSLLNSKSYFGLAAFSLGMRALLAVGVYGLLASRVALGYRQLRIIEYAFFGLEMLLMLRSQYAVNLELLKRGELIGLVAVEKNGVMRALMVMLVYGVFIPNSPRITSRVVLTMAAGPIVVLALVLQHELHTPHIAGQMAGFHNIVASALFLMIGAALAIFSAHMLNGMRKEVSAARQLGQYQLRERLGGGGMGEVYLAEHQLLKRPCAVKLINPDLEDNAIALARFEREVQSAAKLSHPNTIEIYDYGRASDGTFYYVMEYLPGLSVSELVRRGGPLPPGRAVYIARQVCGSLGEAHRLGMIHRDLKPANILVAILGGQCDVAKVLDFGLVKLTDDTGPKLTAEYTVSGTPSYMSPEQAIGTDALDGRADLYALGAILYFMLTGQPPFERDSPMSLMIAHAQEPVRPPSDINKQVPTDLEAVVLRCLAKSPGERYSDARALEAALRQCACSRDWSQTEAEQWWLEQASAHA